jgi:hypothetical protein
MNRFGLTVEQDGGTARQRTDLDFSAVPFTMLDKDFNQGGFA